MHASNPHRRRRATEADDARMWAAFDAADNPAARAEARRAVATRYLALVYAAAKRMARRHWPRVDAREMVGVGTLAVLDLAEETAERRPQRRARFGAFARWHILTAMEEQIRGNEFGSLSSRWTLRRRTRKGQPRCAREKLDRHAADVRRLWPIDEAAERDWWAWVCEPLDRAGRLIVTLHYRERMTFAQVARDTGLSEAWVRERHAAILGSLRGRFDAGGHV